MAFVWQLTILKYPEKTILSGVILNREAPSSRATVSTARSAWAIGSSYFRRTRSGSRLKVSWGESSFDTETDNKGGFILETEANLTETEDLKLSLDGRPLVFEKGVLHSYTIGKSDNLIISDIDDTILVSHTNARFRSIMTTLFRTFDRRRPVTSTSKIFEGVGKSMDYFFVSRSEYNLFPLLSDFIEHNGLPKGPLFLTPFISFGELVRKKKDPDFKIKTINLLLEHASHQNIFLFGDDTQYDLQVYAEVARKHGDRIKRIFIHQTEPGVDRRESNIWDSLNRNFEQVIYYNDDSDLDSITKSLNDLTKIK